MALFEYEAPFPNRAVFNDSGTIYECHHKGMCLLLILTRGMHIILFVDMSE